MNRDFTAKLRMYYEYLLISGQNSSFHLTCSMKMATRSGFVYVAFVADIFCQTQCRMASWARKDGKGVGCILF
jgi:hypothetical protein